MKVKDRKITLEELRKEGWEEIGPFGEHLLFQKGNLEIAWDPETETVKLERKKP